MKVRGPARSFGGVCGVPGDKSVTHRAILVASVAEGTSEIVHPGGGEDNAATIRVVEALGVEVVRPDAEHLWVRGVGLGGLQTPTGPLDCGNSGTTMRLVAGMLAGAGIEAELVGDASLSRRPMARVADPLRDLGFDVSTSAGGLAPVRVRPSAPDRAADLRAILTVASAQVKSSLLLAGLWRTGITEVVEPAVSRDHTERMLRAYGVRCSSSSHYLAPDRGASLSEAPRARVVAPARLKARTVEVPGDLSSAAFLLAAGLLVGDGVRVEGVGVNPTRTGMLDVLERMGASVRRGRRRVLSSGEPVSALSVRPGSLRGTTIAGSEVPLLIDELPVLCVLGAASTGRFEVRDATELRRKESDRIARTVSLLESLGVAVEEREDGLSFAGLGGPVWGSFVWDADGDHRMAMAAAVAGLAGGGAEIAGAEHVAVSYPSFSETCRALGATIEDGGRG